MKKYHFGVNLQSRELNLVLRKTAIIVTSKKGRFRKALSGFQSFFAKSLKEYQNSFSQ